MGHSITRLSIRDSRALVADDADREEAEQTFVCLNASALSILGSMVRTALTRPAAGSAGTARSR